MAWALWLAAPLVLTLLAALWTWWRGRPPREPGTRDSIAAHHAYLDALAVHASAMASPAMGSGGPLGALTADEQDRNRFDG